MKEKKSDFTDKKIKHSILFTGNQKTMLDNDIKSEWILNDVQIKRKRKRRLSDFTFRPVKIEDDKTVSQRAKTSTNNSGSHSLPALHHFKSSHK